MEIDLKDKHRFGPDGKPVDKVREYLKCKMSAYYFVKNYIVTNVAGGEVPLGESTLWKESPKYRHFIKLASSPHVDNIEILFSRQLGKTTTIAAIMLHNLLFFSGLKAQFLTLTKENALDVIERMKFMQDRLPDWLKVPMVGKGDRKTYIEFENKSKFTTKYISGSINPDSIGRGFSSPMLWVDEAAFIPHMDRVWTALQPSLSAARDFAKANNFPTKIFFSTTPNGVSGAGDFFYQTWKNGWDYENIFDIKTEKINPEAQKILMSADDKNNFARVKIHWSEVGRGDDWYQQQVKELNFNMRKVNQELNLVFLGSTNTVFPDEILEKFEPKEVTNEIKLSYGEKFKIYREIDPQKTYLLGVDTAASTAAKSDYCSMVMTDAQTGEEVGSWHGKYSVVKRFSMVVKSLVRGLTALFALDDDNLIVIIERNSFGLGVVEDLLYSDEDFDYPSYLYWYEQKSGERIPGFQTNVRSRELMFSQLLSFINENPTRIHSALLQEELRNLEQKNNGRIEAGGTNNHDDVVLAYTFTLFVRYEMIKSGLIVEDGMVAKLDIERAKAFMDVTMSTTSLGISPTEENYNRIPVEVINNDEKEIEKRLLKEYGYTHGKETLPTLDSFIITGM